MNKVALGRVLPAPLPCALVPGSYLVPGDIIFNIFYINTQRNRKYKIWESEELGEKMELQTLLRPT